MFIKAMFILWVIIQSETYISVLIWTIRTFAELKVSLLQNSKKISDILLFWVRLMAIYITKTQPRSQGSLSLASLGRVEEETGNEV